MPQRITKTLALSAIISLTITGSAAAQSPSTAICPTQIKCRYDGCSKIVGWVVDGHQKSPFQGQKNFQLFKIDAYDETGGSHDYTIQCHYGHQGDSISLFANQYKLHGLWKYSGFNKVEAKCATINPQACIGIYVPY